MRRGRRIVMVVAAVGLVAAALGDPALAADAARSRGVRIRPNQDVSTRSGNESEATIAVNPTNAANVVVVSNLASGSGLFESYTTDGGSTWTKTVIADGDSLGSACCDPSMAFDAYGNLFLVFINSSITHVVAGLSTDGGATWSLLGNVAAAPPASGNVTRTRGGGIDQPSLATGPNSVWFTWTHFGPNEIEARGAAVTGLGQVGAFSPTQAAPSSSAGSFGDIAIGPNGEVMVTYQDGTSGQGPATIYTNTDPDGFGPGGFGPRVTVTATNVGGFDYIPAQSGRSVDAEAGLAWDRSGGPFTGRVYLMYTDEQPNESNNMDILVRSSDDQGATWSAAVPVSDDTTGRSQFLPRISLDQSTGWLAVTWHDARLDDGLGGPGDTNLKPNDDAQYWGTVGRPGGARFLRNFAISAGTSNAKAANNGIDYGDYTGLSFANGVFYPVWADNSNSAGGNPNGALHAFDLYTSKVIVAT